MEDALKEAKAANEAKTMFLSSVSHEIRTPINAVLGLDEMILRESREKDIRRYALDIQNSGRTLLSLINDLLDSSRIEAGKMELVPVEYDLASLLNDLVNMTAVRAEEKGLKLVVDVEKGIPHLLYGDDTRIKQCALNILTNAVKYTREGSITFSVTSKRVGENKIDICFRVADTGIGIKEENIHHLFTAYERIDEARNHGIEGTGLGINIVTSILALMGSKLEVESTYGKGSSFWFTITQEIRGDEPLGDFSEMYEQSIETAVNYMESFHAPDARILVVDDTRMNLTVIRGLLKATEIGIDTAESGQEALQLFAKNDYDIIFLDQRMPEMDGTQTLQKMRNQCYCNTRNCDTPFIMLTADAIVGARERFMEAGFDDYLAKPVNGKKLEKMVLSYLPKDKVVIEKEALEEEGTPESDNRMSGESESRYRDSVFLSALEKIPALSVEDGLSNCMNEEILKETVLDFIVGAKSVPDLIEGYCSNADWENYTIRVHALKSSARIIGAGELSGQAAFLEKCGDERAVDTILEKTPKLLADYRELGEALQQVMDAEVVAKENNPVDEDTIAGAYLAIRELIEAFDYDGAADVLKMLEAYSLSEEQKAHFEEVSDLIRRLERDRLLEIL